MVKFDALIFGYRRLKIDPQDLSSVTSYLIRASIPSVINNDGTITVRERDFEKTRGILSGRIDFIYSKPLGFYGFWKGLSNKGGIISALIISVLLVILLSQLVWDIRVEGNEKITDAEVISLLRDCNFEIGDLWLTSDRGKIETAFLENNKSVSWININRRGTVAYVKLIEKDENAEEDQQAIPKYANIIATTDCVIEEITVKRGTAVVKVGDAVKKGDILVLGALSAESGGEFCAADATVIGRISDSVSVEIDRKEEKISYEDRKLYSFKLKIFKISLNIFKLYGNLTNDCDIIEDEITYSLFGRYKLPLSIYTAHIVNTGTEPIEYTDDELVRIATERLNAITLSRLVGSDLVRIRTSGDFTDDGYRISSDFVFLSDVGEPQEFEIE